jgi:ketosteroid isomerase-like protein
MNPDAPAASTGRSDSRALVEEFYRALAAGAPEAVRQLIEDNFTEDASLARPESLPGGGILAGRDRIKRLMMAVAAADGGPLDARQMRVTRVLESVGDDRDEIGVELTFPWRGTTTTSFEWWVLQQRKVVEIRAFYWDTAMMLGHGPHDA